MHNPWRSQLEKLEKQARSLETTPETRATWFQQIQQHIEAYLEGLPHWPVREDQAEAAAEIKSWGIATQGQELTDILALLHRTLERQGLKPSSGGYLAYIPGGGVFPSALGDLLAAVGNHYAGFFYGSPAAVRMENLLIKWVAEFLGFDGEAVAGNLTSGGSYASLIAMHTAREAMDLQPKDQHLAVVYHSSQIHHTALKSLRVVGLSNCVFRKIPVDAAYRLSAPALRQQIEADQQAGLRPFLILCSAGSTDVGAVDPLADIAQIKEEYGLWMHVDAAYGGFFGLLAEIKPLFKGIEKADSLIIDPHKGMFIALGTGMVLVRKKEWLLQAHTSTANYLQDVISPEDELSPADLSPELSKHFRGLRMWLPLQLFGEQAFRQALQEKLFLARWFYEEINIIPDIEVGPFPDLSVVLFRLKPRDTEANPANEALLKFIQADGRVWISSTLLDGGFYLRLAVLHFRSHFEHVSHLVELIRAFTGQTASAKQSNLPQKLT
ncbi:MAG: pyridoxal-dependent decarboxylase [Bacteroidota bacterium]